MLGGFFSIHFALHPTPIWESDLHTSTVHRQNKSLELRGKLEGIELSLKVSRISFYLLDACLFGSFIVKQCRVEETEKKGLWEWDVVAGLLL